MRGVRVLTRKRGSDLRQWVMTWQQTEQGRAYRAEYRARNRETLRVKQREYRAQNQEADKERKRAWRAQNPEKARAQDLRARARKDPQRLSEWQRVHRLFRNHGLRPEDWTALWADQGGRCYLCSADLVEGKVHVEHDHSCCPKGRSCEICRRGLACGTCNRSIALAGDDPGRLRRMADALEIAKREVAERMASRSA